MHRWSVGDHALTCNFLRATYNNREVYIKSLYARRGPQHVIVGGDHPRRDRYKRKRWAIPIRNIKPFDDEQGRDMQREDMRKVSWDDCAWKPKELETVEGA